jgi:ABC-2 type transport system ATP-binding protein
MIRTRGLGKQFGRRWAVRDLDLDIRPGEFFGFLGPNGSGKSTTIKLLTTLLLPTAGTMHVAGHDVLASPLAVKRVIGVLPEEIQTYDRLTVQEIVDFTGRVHGLHRSEIRQRGDELLDVMELARSERDKLLVDCSMGMRKKTVLACALIHKPRVLFLDEPFNGIDARTGLAIRRILTRLTASGTTIFFSSHILELVEKLCTRLAILEGGTIRAQGTLPEIAVAAGLPAGSPLEDAFLALVDKRPPGGEGELAWLTSSSS